MDLTQWIALISLFTANVGALLAFFIKIKVEMAELTERHIAGQQALTEHKRELAEHKEDNKVTFAEIKSLLSENKKDNREDHGKLFDKLDTVSMQVINATKTFINSPAK